jgi:hypothetical protein
MIWACTECAVLTGMQKVGMAVVGVASVGITKQYFSPAVTNSCTVNMLISSIKKAHFPSYILLIIFIHIKQ